MNSSVAGSQTSPKNVIGTQHESSLHAALKEWYARPGDRLEEPIGGYLVDIVRGDLLIEVQTGNFGALRSKLKQLLPEYRFLVAHPIAQEKWICRVDGAGQQTARRKSPKRGRIEEIFSQLTSLVHLISNPHLTMEVVLIKEEVVWLDDGRGSWRRKGWSVADRRLLQVLAQISLTWPDDYLAFIPSELTQPFSNRDLAEALGIRRRLAEQITYCLRKMDLIQFVKKRGRFSLYTPVGNPKTPMNK